MKLEVSGLVEGEGIQINTSINKSFDQYFGVGIITILAIKKRWSSVHCFFIL